MRAMTMAFVAICASSVSLVGAPNSRALDYPTHVVSIVVPYPPGGSADAMARPLANQLSKEWSSPVIIESKPGAGTTVGAGFVAASNPDGYTLYIAATSHAISASLYKSLRYDPVRGFAGVSLIFSSPFILAVAKSSGMRDASDLIARARANPGKLNFGSSGIGAGPHLSGEIFRQYAGIQVTHVPYNGSATPLVELLGGRIDYVMTDASAMPMIRNGDIIPLAVTSPKRYRLLPDVPTMAEVLPGAPPVTNWGAILAPAGTPADTISLINAGIRKALDDPQVKNVYLTQGYDVAPSTPVAVDAFITEEATKFRSIIQSAGITPQ